MRLLPVSFLIVLPLFVLLTSCDSTAADQTLNKVEIEASAIDGFLSSLASDEFEGRKPFTDGETKTTEYLKAEFEKMGLLPGNDGSYYQDVPLVEIDPTPSETMLVKGKDETLELKLETDYAFYTEREQAEITLENAPLVFCGYGIVAPEYNWNDYEGLDMKGKIAVVLVNDPGFEGDSTIFKGNTMTYYGRWTYKYEEAARQGAAGVLIVHETRAAGYPWFVVKGSGSSPRLNLQTPDGNAGRCAVQGWMTLTAAARIFAAAGRKGTDFYTVAKQRDFKPFPLDATASLSLSNEFKKDVSKNVVAMIEGTERPDEYIVYSAHWDHMGIGAVVNGDSIYNGAVDNASGTSAALAIAKAFTELPEKPERSIVFLIVTAEEQGLLGSAYYAANPIFPVVNTVANINMDAMNAFGKMRDLEIVGYGHSQMDEYAKEAAEAQGRYIVPDQESEKGFFFRSDHFNFAKVGIPALYAAGGMDHIEKGKEFGKAQREGYTAERYHQPSDHYNSDWDLSGIVQDAQLFFNVGLKLAGEKTFPQWKEGSEFKAKRDEDMKVKG